MAIMIIAESVQIAESLNIHLQLFNVSTDHLIFKWNQSVQCSSLQYKINTTGCGNCSNHTVNDMIVTCDDVPIDSTGEGFCTFTVKAVICENSENSSNSVTVTLKGSVYYKPDVVTIHFISVIS